MKSVDQVMLEITPILRDALQDDSLVLTLDTSAKNVDGWDSLTHTAIIAAVESHYNIRFRLKEVLNFHNVEDLCEAVLRLSQ